MFLNALYSYERHFLYSKKFVSFVNGVLPNIDSRKRFLIFLIIFICFSPVLFQMCYQFFTANLKLEMAIRLLQKIIPTLCIFCFYCVLYIHVEARILLFAHVKKDYELVSDNEELNIIEKYTKLSKYYTMLLIVLYNLYIMLLTFPSILKIILYHLGILDDIYLTLPLSIGNVSDVGLIYYCLFIHQIIVLYIGLGILTISTSSFLVLLQHAFSQFNIVIMKIRRPFKDHFNDEKFLNELDWIIDIIIRYKRATELINLINSSKEIVLLITIFFLTLIIILNFVCIFQFSLDWNNISESIEMIVFIVASMFIVYLYFYIGQELLDHSSSVFEELCQVPFYLFSIKTQKLFLFLVMICRKPNFLSIGRLFVSSHEVCAALLQKTFSFATVFYTMKTRELM